MKIIPKKKLIKIIKIVERMNELIESEWGSTHEGGDAVLKYLNAKDIIYEDDEVYYEL